MHSASSLISFEGNRLPLVIPLPKRPWPPDLQGSHPIKRPPTLNSSSSLPRPFTSIRSTPPSPQQAPYPSVLNLGPRPSSWLHWPAWSPGAVQAGPPGWSSLLLQAAGPAAPVWVAEGSSLPSWPTLHPHQSSSTQASSSSSSAPRYFFLPFFFFSLGKVCSAPAPGEAWAYSASPQSSAETLG